MSSTPGNQISIRNPFPSAPTAPPTTGPPNLTSINPPPPPPPGPGGAMNPGQNNPSGMPVQIPGGGLLSPATASALEHYRLTQLYQYAMAAERLRVPQGSFMPQIPPGMRPELAPLFYAPYCRIDPRLAGLCRPPEEPKPQFSYIGLIAMAILSSPEKKLVLSDIYQYILDNYPYFRTRGPGWRNSIRHNLSLNDCFIKAGRSANGKGHYWAIHPANVDDFQKGDFRRRKAQRKVRRHMGLAVDDDDSPSPPPASPPPAWHHHHPALFHPGGPHPLGNPMALGGNPPNAAALDLPATLFGLSAAAAASLSGKSGQDPGFHHHPMSSTLFNRKRQFDVASLLAPEKEASGGAVSPHSYKSDDPDRDQSLSSPSPPPGSEGTLKRSKIYKRAGDFDSRNDSSDDESIEVTEDEHALGKSHHILSRKCRGGGDHGDHDEASSPQITDSDKINHLRDESGSSRGASPQPHESLSPKKEKGMNKFLKSGQCGTSSNDEEDSGCKPTMLPYGCGGMGRTTLLSQHHAMSMSRNERINSNSNANGSVENELGGGGLHPNNMQLTTSLQMLNQQNLLNQSAGAPGGVGGTLPPLEILQAHHHHLAQQQQNQNHHPMGGGQGPPVGFPFGIPGGHQFLQQNPSLASLMLLSSKYRELTMNAALKRPQP